MSRLSGQVSFVSLCFLLLGPSVAHVVFRGSIWRSDHKNNEPGLLFFSIPFSETEQGVAQAIIRSVLDFRRDPWPKVSENAKDLIRKMLDPDQKRRLTAQQVLDHPWLQNAKTAPNVSLGETVRARLKQFTVMNKLKKRALRVKYILLINYPKMYISSDLKSLTIVSFGLVTLSR